MQWSKMPDQIFPIRNPKGDPEFGVVCFGKLLPQTRKTEDGAKAYLTSTAEAILEPYVSNVKKTLPKVERGRKRGWRKCNDCGDVAYMDYTPFSLSTPITTLPCGHDTARRLSDATTTVDEKEALLILARKAYLKDIEK